MPKSTPANPAWKAVLLLPGKPSACGIATSTPVPMPGHYTTQDRAMEAAHAALRQHTEAKACTAMQMEAPLA